VNCFYHQNEPAIGICKSCGKGVCRECAVDFTQGLACRGRCEDDVQTRIRQINDYDKVLAQNREQTEQAQKNLTEDKSARGKHEADRATWRKAMSDYESKYSPSSERSTAIPADEVVDSDKHYDLYCSERQAETVVYPDVRIKGLRQLFKKRQFEVGADFYEVEQSNGQIVFIARMGLIKFCETGTTLNCRPVSQHA
jgi:hypothetical protein